MPDPKTILEIANTFFAGISAAAAAISAWRGRRNKKDAAKAFDEAFGQAKRSPEAQAAAEELVSIIPPEVVQDLEARADKCWTGYRKALGGDYLAEEVDDATVGVRACVCRELRRLRELNGDIPPRWKGQWERFKCGDDLDGQLLRMKWSTAQVAQYEQAKQALE